MGSEADLSIALAGLGTDLTMLDEWIPQLETAPLFAGMSAAEISEVLSCLHAYEEAFSRDTYVFRAEDKAARVGLILSGQVHIVQEDFWGNQHIVSACEKNQTFGEAFALVSDTTPQVSVIARASSEILFLDAAKILAPSSLTCPYHNKMVQNLLKDIARKNVQQHEKLTHLAQRSTRAKVLSYLSAQARRCGRNEFDIPYSRQQLADYLSVDRCGLSTELSKMHNEGLVDFNKNHFQLRLPFPESLV